MNATYYIRRRLKLLTSKALRVCCGAACMGGLLFTPGNSMGASKPNQIFPVGELRLTRDSVTSSGFRLSITNLNPLLYANAGRGITQTYLVGGAVGREPMVQVASAEFARYVNGVRIETRQNAPPANDDPNSSAPIVRVSAVGMLRLLQVYSLGLTVSQNGPNSTGEDVWVLEEAQLNVELGQAPSPGAGVDQALYNREVEILSDQVINPDLDPAYWVPPLGEESTYAENWIRMVNASIETGPAFRFSVYAPGLYRLDPKTLLQSTSETIELPPANKWRLFRNGAEVPTLADFGETGTLAFIVSEQEARTLQEQPYWLFTQLKADGEQSAGPRRFLSATTSQTTAPEITTGIFSVTGQGFTDYHAKLASSDDSTRWFWKGLSDRDAQAFPIDLPEWFSPSDGAKVSIKTRYGLSSFVSTLPELRCFVNGHDVGPTTITLQQGEAVISVQSNLFNSGKNEVGLRIEYPGSVVPQDMLVQKLKLEWEQTLTAETVGVPFSLPQVRSASVLGVSGVHPGSQTHLFECGLDVKLGTELQTTTGALYSISGIGGEYLLASRAARVKHPKRIVPASSLPDLYGANHDYIVITDNSLTSAVQPLLRHREAQGHRVLHVSPEVLFDQFTFGKRDGEAAHKFLRYLFHKSEKLKPRYLLLVGESSDFRGDPELMPPRAQVDMVPTIGPPVGEGMRGDHGYGTICGDDALQDIAVGRLPVATGEELSALIEKIFQYETTPHGSWALRSDFVLDDNEEFPTAVDSVVSLGTAPPATVRKFEQSNFGYDLNMRVPMRKRSRIATDLWLKQFNEGAGTVTFFGHGGPNLWSHERLMHLQDMPLVKNAPRLPFVTCASCDNAWIDYPLAPVSSSIGEMLVKKPDGGAIGLFGPVAGASPFEHSVLVRRLMEGIYRAGIREQGLAVQYAKNLYFAESRSTAVPMQYLLLGDPAIRLKIPQVEPLQVRPTSVPAAEPAALRVSVPGKSGGAGMVNVTRLDRAEELTSVPLSTKPVLLPATDAGEYAVNVTAETSPTVASSRLRVQARPEAKQATSSRIVKVPDGTGRHDSIEVHLIGNADGNTSFLSGETPILQFALVNSSSDQVTGTLQLWDGPTTLSTELPFSPIAAGQRTRVNVPTQRSLPEGTSSMTLSLNESGSVTRYAITLEAVKPADLQFVPGTERVWGQSDPLVQRQTVFLSAKLRNAGGVIARNVILQALIGPGVGTEALTINDQKREVLTDIGPGVEREVVFRWEDANRPGEHLVRLVANGGRSIKETNYDDNQTTMPPVVIAPVTNYWMADLKVTPSTAAPGDPISFEMRFHQEAPITGQPIDIEYGFHNGLSGETTSVREVLLRVNNDETLTRTLILPEGFTTCFATINASREAEEVTLGDSTKEQTLAVRMRPTLHQGRMDLASAFQVSSSDNLDALGSDGLTVGDRFTSVGVEIPIDEELVTSGSYTTTESPMHGGDNAWLLASSRLEALGSEDPGAIELSLDTTTLPGFGVADVYAMIAAARDPDMHWGDFDLSLNGVPKEYRFSDVPGERHREVLLGQIPLEKGNVKVSVRPANGASVYLQKFVLRPRMGVLTTPIIELGEDTLKKHVTLNMNGTGITSATARLQARTVTADGGDWSGWVTADSTELAIPPGQSQLQGRVYLLEQEEQRAVLQKLELIFK